MELDLTLIWAILIATAVFLYVAMDGFDLGLGILFPAVRTKAEGRDGELGRPRLGWQRDLARAGRRRVVRGVSAGLRHDPARPVHAADPDAARPRVPGRRLRDALPHGDAARATVRDRAFSWGSFMAAFCQGIALGAFVQGIRIEGRAYAGGWWDWLTPFSVLTASRSS